MRAQSSDYDPGYAKFRSSDLMGGHPFSPSSKELERKLSSTNGRRRLLFFFFGLRPSLEVRG
jgi:hypothetical protein